MYQQGAFCLRYVTYHMFFTCIYPNPLIVSYESITTEMKRDKTT